MDEPITLQTNSEHDDAPDPSEEFSQPNDTLAYLITAVIFFALGFVIAGLIGFSFGDSDITSGAVSINEAVNGTLIALTPLPTATATPAPVEITYSPDRDYVIGNPNAPITIVEFSDYRCPYCGRFALETLPRLLDHYGDDLKFVYRDFPIFGEASIRAAHGVACADRQDSFLDYHYLLFASQIQQNPVVIADASLVDLASQVNLNIEQFEACLDDNSISQDIQQNFEAGIDLLGSAPTPTFLINGKRYVGAQPFETWVAVIDQELLSLGITPPSS